MIAAFKPEPPTSIARIRSVLVVTFVLLAVLRVVLLGVLPGALRVVLLAVLPAVLGVVLRVTTVSPDCVGATR
jgi:hypothetical protein